VKFAETSKRADALAAKLEQSESARMKAEADAATVEDLQKKLDDAKKALEENVAQHAAREEEILRRLESQSRRFVSKCPHLYAFLRRLCSFFLLDQLSFYFT
jgi:chromosome segregation ATPase